MPLLHTLFFLQD